MEGRKVVDGARTTGRIAVKVNGRKVSSRIVVWVPRGDFDGGIRSGCFSDHHFWTSSLIPRGGAVLFNINCIFNPKLFELTMVELRNQPPPLRCSTVKNMVDVTV